MMVAAKLVTKKITMKQMFNNYNIVEKQHQTFIPFNNIQVNTPYGFRNIQAMFRTQRQQTCRVYCSNNKTIQVGASHRFKINGS